VTAGKRRFEEKGIWLQKWRVLTGYVRWIEMAEIINLYTFLMRKLSLLVSAIGLGILFTISGLSSASAANEIKVQAAQTEGLNATISWTVEDKVKNTIYQIELTDKSKSKKNTKLFKTSKTKFTFTALKPWNEYSYRIRGVVGARVYSWSKPKVLTSTQKAITEVYATNINYQSASISWDAVAGATGYKVYVDGTLNTVTLKTSHEFKNLRIGREYAVTVSAIRGSLEGARSEESLLKTLDTAPANLINTALTNTTAKFEWSAISGVDDYEVYLGDRLIERVKSNSYEFKGQLPGTVLDVRVTGRFGDDRTPAANGKFVTLKESPTSLKMVESTANSLKFEWLGSKNFTKYYVYLDGKRSATVTTTSHTFTALKQGQILSVYVTGVEQDIESAASTTVEANTQVLTPDAPKVVVNGATSATISWKADLAAKNFVVNIYDGAKGVAVITSTMVGTATSTTISSGLIPGSRYTATLSIEYPASTTSPSGAVEFVMTRPAPSGLRVSGITTTQATLNWEAVTGAVRYEYARDSLVPINTGNITNAVISGLLPGVTYSIQVRSAFSSDLTTANVSEFSTAVTFTTLPDVSAKPVNATVPVLSVSSTYTGATAIVGATMVTTNGTWTSTPAPSRYTYQWQRSTDNGTTWNDLQGATNSTYVLVESDYGFKVRAVVTATNTNGSTATPSAASDAVGTIGVIQIPVARGTLVVGQILAATQGTWFSKDPLSYTYEWLRNGSEISGATSATYTLVDADIGKSITVKVTARSSLGSVSSTSAARGSVPAILSTAAPTISGTLRTAQTLTATTGTWLNTPDSYSYQWEQSADGILWDAISGATSSTYVLASDLVGKFVRVQVRATKSTYTEVVYSAGTTAIAGTVTGLVISNTSAPVVSGVWSTGSVLTTSSGSWSTSGTFTYKWQISSDGSTWTDISGATTSTYTIVSGDARKFIRSVVTITSSTGAGTAYSASTSKINAPYNTVAPAVTGTKRVAAVQTTTDGTWSNSPTSYTYQWQTSTNGISWINIGSATSATYSPTFAQANLQIRVVVTASNADSDTATATSNVVSGFLPPEATVIPVVSGTTTVGQTLTTTSGTWGGSPSNSDYVYQWQRSTDGVTWSNISAATATTYVPVAGDAGYLVRSQVSLSTNAGTSVAYSLATAAIAP